MNRPASLLLPLALAASLGTAAVGQTIPVGVARVEVTPDYPVRLTGYASRKEESKGIQSRLWVRALAIGSDADGPAVLLSADVLGITREIAESVAERLEREAKIPRSKVALAASHTHGAPSIRGLATFIHGEVLSPGHAAHIERFSQELTDALGRAALEALKSRRPASLGWAQGSVGFAVNRRVLKDGKWVNFGEVPDGPVDHALPVLVAKDSDGKPFAIVTNYACHCTTLNPNDNLLSADWAGYAQEAIERDFPGSIALTLIGCGADANPKGRPGLKVAQAHGWALADEVKRLLSGTLKPIRSAPTCRLSAFDLPLDTPPTRDELEKKVKTGGGVGFTAKAFLDRLDRGDSLPTAVPYAVQTWAFGDDLLMVFLAGEVVVDYDLRLKKELDADRLWITAYANAAPCYIPSERILREGGYEATGSMDYYGWPTRLKPGLEDRIDEAVRKIVPEAFVGGGK